LEIDEQGRKRTDIAERCVVILEHTELEAITKRLLRQLAIVVETMQGIWKDQMKLKKW